MNRTLDAAFVCEKGRRARNEDAVVCPDHGTIFAVIDGMGGQARGDRAAAIARDVIAASSDPVASLVQVNEALVSEAERDPELKGMGCVATVVQLRGGSLDFAHVGDTMAYLASSDSVDALTRKHTRSAELQRELALVDAEAAEAGGSNLLTLDLGGQRRTGTDWIDTGLQIPFEVGDMLVLCSDGVHGVIPHAELTAMLRDLRAQRASAANVASVLVERALALGSADNSTALVVRMIAGASAADATLPSSPVATQESLTSSAPSNSSPRLAFAAGVLVGLVVGVLIGAVAAFEWFASSPPAEPHGATATVSAPIPERSLDTDAEVPASPPPTTVAPSAPSIPAADRGPDSPPPGAPHVSP